MSIPLTDKIYWKPAESDKLDFFVKLHGAKNWQKIADSFSKDLDIKRSDIQCYQHWKLVLNPEVTKGFWTKQEDGKLK